MRVLSPLVVLLFTAGWALAGDEPKQSKDITDFLQAYASLQEKYPAAAKAFAIVDAQTKIQIPHCVFPEHAVCTEPAPGGLCNGIWECRPYKQ